MLVTEKERELSVNEAAERLGVHPNTVRYGLEHGTISGKKVLGRWRIAEREVERVLRGEAQQNDRLS